MSKYTKRLDRSKDFGTYHPPAGRARYTQGGFDFDHEGFMVDENLNDAQRAELDAKFVKRDKPATPARPSSKDGEKDAADPPSDNDDKDADGDGPNLEMWLRGEEEYAFPDVQKAVKERYSVWKTAKRDLVMFLVEDQKVVEPDALSDEFKSLIA